MNICHLIDSIEDGAMGIVYDLVMPILFYVIWSCTENNLKVSVVLSNQKYSKLFTCKMRLIYIFKFSFRNINSHVYSMRIEYLYRVHCEHNTFEYLLSILKYKTKFKFNTEKCYLMIPGGVHVI